MEPTDFEARLAKIEIRNMRVESNKKWETSILRRGSIAILTYVSVVSYHLAIGAKNIIVISAVPVLGFMLSTMSFQFIRRQFEKRSKKV